MFVIKTNLSNIFLNNINLYTGSYFLGYTSIYIHQICRIPNYYFSYSEHAVQNDPLHMKSFNSRNLWPLIMFCIFKKNLQHSSFQFWHPWNKQHTEHSLILSPELEQLKKHVRRVLVQRKHDWTTLTDTSEATDRHTDRYEASRSQNTSIKLA